MSSAKRPELICTHKLSERLLFPVQSAALRISLGQSAPTVTPNVLTALPLTLDLWPHYTLWFVSLMLAKLYHELNQLCLMWPYSCSTASWKTRSNSIFFFDFRWPVTREGVSPKPFSFKVGLHRYLLQHGNWQICHAKSMFTLFMPIISLWLESHFSMVRHSALISWWFVVLSKSEPRKHHRLDH